jgi:DNA-binding XRE family transcriptional regulator
LTGVYLQRTFSLATLDVRVYREEGLMHTEPKQYRRRWPRGTWMRLISPDVLRTWMGHTGKSLTDLANAAAVSRGFISHLTAGRKNTCKPSTAVAIARCLDVPLEALFVPSISRGTGQTIKQRGRAA